jgi:hypothetical protein
LLRTTDQPIGYAKTRSLARVTAIAPATGAGEEFGHCRQVDGAMADQNRRPASRDSVIEVDAMMWKPRPGGKPSTQAALVAARATFREIHSLRGEVPGLLKIVPRSWTPRRR